MVHHRQPTLTSERGEAANGNTWTYAWLPFGGDLGKQLEAGNQPVSRDRTILRERGSIRKELLRGVAAANCSLCSAEVFKQATLLEQECCWSKKAVKQLEARATTGENCDPSN